MLEPLDRFVLDRQSMRIVDGAVGIIAILALQGENLVFQASVFGAKRMRKLLAFVEL